jgi:hypothetical protein
MIVEIIIEAHWVIHLIETVNELVIELIIAFKWNIHWII